MTFTIELRRDNGNLLDKSVLPANVSFRWGTEAYGGGFTAPIVGEDGGLLVGYSLSPNYIYDEDSQDRKEKILKEAKNLRERKL